MNLFGLRRLGCVVLSFVLWVAVICGSSGDDDTLLSVDMGAGESPVLYIGLMIHLEAHPSTTRTEHEAYRDEIMNYAELFDESGSTLSIQRERYLREEIIQFEHNAGLG